MAKNKKPVEVDLLFDIPVNFGSVSFGKKTARVGVTIDRKNLSLAKADNTFCDRRLTVTIHAEAPGDQVGQGRLAGMDESTDLVGVADVKGFKVDDANLGLGLTFNIVELKKTAVSFSDFAGREGRLMIAHVADIPEEAKARDNDDGEGEGKGGEE